MIHLEITLNTCIL